MVLKQGQMRAEADAQARRQADEENVSDYEVEQPARKKKKPPTRKEKGKGIAQSSRHQEAAGDSDVPQPNPRKQSSTKKGATKEKATEKKQKPTPALRLAKMRKMAFTQTRWADHQLLHDLGIYHSVHAILRDVGLGGLFHMSNAAYKDATMEFIATFSFYDDTSLDMADENRGRISFRVNNTPYEMPLAQMCVLYHLPQIGDVPTLEIDRREAMGVWAAIASGDYTKGVSKAARIRNPAIRYAHKFLAHTLFERRETGAVKEDEFALLIDGIKRFLVTDGFGTQIRGQRRRLHLGRFLVGRFQYYQEWVWNNRDATPTIGFGGLVTPILLACGATLTPIPSSTVPLRIDAAYLSGTRFLAGSLSNKRYGYRFKTEDDEERVVILPNQGITLLNVRENVLFKPQPFLYHDPRQDGTMRVIKKAPPAQRVEEEETEPAGPQPVYGSHRYDFEPYAEAINNEALRTAHEHIGKLQRFAKWQGKQLKKLVKMVKSQGKMIKSQGKMIKKLFTDRSGEGEGTSMPMSLTNVQPDEAAQSSRRSKGKAPISSSSSGSGNYSYNLESSSSHST